MENFPDKKEKRKNHDSGVSRSLFTWHVFKWRCNNRCITAYRGPFLYTRALITSEPVEKNPIIFPCPKRLRNRFSAPGASPRVFWFATMAGGCVCFFFLVFIHFLISKTFRLLTFQADKNWYFIWSFPSCGFEQGTEKLLYLFLLPKHFIRTFPYVAGFCVHFFPYAIVNFAPVKFFLTIDYSFECRYEIQSVRERIRARAN